MKSSVRILAAKHRGTVVRILRTQMLAGVSQVSAALQLVALILVVGRGRSSDTYVTLFSASQVPLSVVVFGTLQPLILSRPGYEHWSKWSVWGSVANIVVVVGAGAFLLVSKYPANTVLAVSAALAVSGSMSIAAAVEGVHLAALGEPGALAIVTVLPNVTATVFVIASPIAKVVMMCIGLLAGNLVMVVMYQTRVRRKRAMHAETPKSGDEVGSWSREDAVGLLVSSSVGAGGPFALQAVTATYSAGQTTILSFVSRVASGVVSIGVTAFANATTDWERRSTRPLKMLAHGCAVMVAVALFVLCVAGSPTGKSALDASVAAMAFVASAAGQAAMSRSLSMYGRYGIFRMMAAVSVPLYAAAVAFLALGPHTAASYFTSIAALAVIAGTFFGASLRWWKIVVIYLATLVVCLLAVLIKVIV